MNYNIREKIREEVIKDADLSKNLSDEDILELLDLKIVEYSKSIYLSFIEKEKLRKDIFNSIRRLDILQELIDDKNITEIMVNGFNNIFIEKSGQLIKINRKFENEQRLEDVIQQIASKSNRIVNEANPIVDARLYDGSRVNIVLSPISLDGPAITIRKFPDKPITIETLIKIGSITEEVSKFLQKLVIAGYNIFISGGTGSGKTTFLNVLSNFIPKDERIITIEDSAELQIRNIENLVRLEVRNANVEGNNEISIRDLIKSAMRMRPSRLVIGEIRDGAAIDMLQALNTGHDGSLSTGHANSPKDMLSRIEALVLLNADMPLLAVRKQIASAIDVIVHLGRLRDKTRKVLEITEILDCVDGEIQTNSIYKFIEEGEENSKVIGHIKKTENELINCFKLERAGIKLV